MKVQDIVKKKRTAKRFSFLWTSLGLKFVVQIAQLIDRAFAVSVAGANVKAREITTGESPC